MFLNGRIYGTGIDKSKKKAKKKALKKYRDMVQLDKRLMNLIDCFE